MELAGDFTRGISQVYAQALFPPSGPGKVKTGMQQIMESMLAECREKLKKPNPAEPEPNR